MESCLRPFRSRSAWTFWWLSLAAVVLIDTRVAMAHSLQRPSVLQSSLEVLGAVLVALLIVRFPRRILVRIAAIRRERALFRSMVSHSRQASFVCEPMRGPGGTIFDFRILCSNKRAAQFLGAAAEHPKNLLAILRTLVRSTIDTARLQYQVDRLKIDRSFVSRVTYDSNAAAIVCSVITKAHNLGFRVCAEGAETEEQVDFLFRRRCDEIQGYLFARPVPFDDLHDTIQAVEKPAGRHCRETMSARRNLGPGEDEALLRPHGPTSSQPFHPCLFNPRPIRTCTQPY